MYIFTLALTFEVPSSAQSLQCFVFKATCVPPIVNHPPTHVGRFPEVKKQLLHTRHTETESEAVKCGSGCEYVWL